jgi:hypothetical protein
MSKKRVTSRLANKQRKELTKQSIVLIALSIIIGLLFLLIILPHGVRLFFRILDQQVDLTQREEIAPLPPMASLTQDITNESQVEISGFGEANSVIKVEVNNKFSQEKETNDSGEFKVSIDLIEGENIIRLINVNENGVESSPRIFTITKDTSAPEIIITHPEDGAEFKLREEEIIQVQGETKPRSEVYLNDRLSYADSNGFFSIRHQLKSGENILSIRVVDRAGNETEKEIIVYYQY